MKASLPLVFTILFALIVASCDAKDASVQRRDHEILNRVIKKRADIVSALVGGASTATDTAAATTATSSADSADTSTSSDDATSAAETTTQATTTAETTAAATTTSATLTSTSSAVTTSSSATATETSTSSSISTSSSSSSVSSTSESSSSTTGVSSTSASSTSTTATTTQSPTTTDDQNSTNENETSTVVRTNSGGTVTAVASAESVTATATAAEVTSTKKKSTAVTIIIALAASAGGVFILFTVFRKWKLSSSSKFDKRLQPIDWTAPGEGATANRLSATSSFHSGSHHGSDEWTPATLARSRSNNMGVLPEHDFTAGPTNAAPVGDYANLSRGESDQDPNNMTELSRGLSLNAAQGMDYQAGTYETGGYEGATGNYQDPTGGYQYASEYPDYQHTGADYQNAGAAYQHTEMDYQQTGADYQQQPNMDYQDTTAYPAAVDYQQGDTYNEAVYDAHGVNAYAGQAAGQAYDASQQQMGAYSQSAGVPPRF